jgi:hypothetical protein
MNLMINSIEATKSVEGRRELAIKSQHASGFVLTGFSDKWMPLILVPAIHFPRLRFNEVHNHARQRSILEVDLFHCLSPFDDLSSS